MRPLPQDELLCARFDRERHMAFFYTGSLLAGVMLVAAVLTCV